MIKSKKQMFIVIGVFALVMLLSTVTYAFFNYTRTGIANTISVGRMVFVTRQTETINLTNLFPIDPTETGIMDDATKVGTLEIEIEGDTDYSEGVEYLISTVNSQVTTGTGKTVPISLDVTVTGLGTPSDSYFTARNSKNATIYKRLSGDSVVGDQQLLVGYIKPNTTSGTDEGVDGKITIKAYFDKNKIAISDTYDGTESDNMGTTNNWVNGRTVLTTSEWNSLSTNGISFQVKIEANEGIWVRESQVNVRRLDFTSNNPSMTIAQLNATGDKTINLSTSVVINENSDDEKTLYAKMKLQGTSSLSYDKKNYTITFYSDEELTTLAPIDVGKNWGSQSKYNLKANWIDYTQSRNIVSARLAAQMQKKYNLFLSAPNNGLIDGFFIEVYIDGNYQGLFTMNIPKDDWMFNMDSSNPNHIVFCGENPNKGSSTAFRALTSKEKDGIDWSVEVGEVNDTTYAKLNRLIDFVMNSTDIEFKNNFSQYLNMDATLNYFAFVELATATDSLGKNMLLVTYDGNVWYPSLYDLDTTWGIVYDGSGTLYPQKSYADCGGSDNLLLERIIEIFPEELENRYKELRRTVLSNQNIIDTFNEFYETATAEMWQREHAKWSNIPNPASLLNGSTGINQILSDLTYHANFADSFMDSIYIPTRTYNESNLIYSLAEPYYGAPYKYMDTGIKLYTGSSDANSQYTIFIKYTPNSNTTTDKETLLSETSVWHDNGVRDGLVMQDDNPNSMSIMYAGSDITRQGYEGLGRYTVGSSSYVALTVDNGVYRIYGYVDDIDNDFGNYLCTPERDDVYDACYSSPVTGRLDMRKKSNSLNDTSYVKGNLTVGSTFFLNGASQDTPHAEDSFTGVINELYVYNRKFTNYEIRTKLLSMQQ